MDGRVQLPVIAYLKKRFQVDYVDVVSEPGPNGILAKQTDLNLVKSILNRVDISVQNHGSVGIAIIGHHDCAGNPAGKEEQFSHIHDAVEFVRSRFAHLEILGLWVNENWKVEEVAK
jgi:hypothetical protein